MTAADGFHRWLTLADARRDKGLAVTAEPAELAAVARRFDLVAVESLEARLSFAFDGDDVAVGGLLEAEVVQRCVATGEPLSARLSSELHVRYVPLARLEAAEADAEIELGAEDLDIIGYAGLAIDIGDMLADTLALELDPFPRIPDADAWLAARGISGEAEAGPFGALAGLANRLKSGDEDRDDA